MGVRLSRKKPRNWVASIAYRLNRIVPHDITLDLAAITDRLARDNAAKDSLNIWAADDFIARHIKPDDRVLEIGCNSGRVLSSIRALERVGVDTDRQAIERGRREHPDLTLIAGEAREYLQSAGRFDVLLLSHVLEHLDDPEGFLGEFEGRFDRVYVEVPDFEWNSLNAVRLQRGRTLIYTDEDHVAEFDRQELEEIFRATGFQILDCDFRWGVMRYWLIARSGNRSDRN
jgi:SAM-dependent methyltransferase